MVDGWASRQLHTDAEFKAEIAKAQIMITMANLQSVIPDYGKDDLLVVRRGTTFEVWTQKAFKPLELMFLPQATEIKARFYTMARSVIAKNTLDAASKDKRPFVIDGRVRGNPSPDSKSKFGLFWLVQRLEKDDPAKKDINMTLQYTTFGFKGTLGMGGGKYEKYDVDADAMPEIGMLVNPNKIPAHTRLLAAEDQAIKELLEKQQKEQGKSDKAEAVKVASSSSSKAKAGEAVKAASSSSSKAGATAVAVATAPTKKVKKT